MWSQGGQEVHFASLAVGESAPGGGRMGGRLLPWAWRWVSISLTSMAGATALTGIEADSAPQMPLKMSCLSLGAAMGLRAAWGVPPVETPRTSSSGGPSTEMGLTAGGRRGGDRESGGDVLEVEAIGLALLFGFVDQQLAELGVGDRLGGGDDEIALAPGGHVPDLGAAVAVGGGEAGDGEAGHEKGV